MSIYRTRRRFSVHEELRIGDDVIFGPGVMILSGSHPIESVKEPFNSFSEGISGRCIIGHNAWIAVRVILIGDLRICEGAVIAAGAIVTKDIPPYTVAGGVPCRPIRRRFSDRQLNSHLIQLGAEAHYDEIIASRNSVFAIQSDAT